VKRSGPLDDLSAGALKVRQGAIEGDGIFEVLLTPVTEFLAKEIVAMSRNGTDPTARQLREGAYCVVVSEIFAHAFFAESRPI
jgi:hypothetical protein